MPEGDVLFRTAATLGRWLGGREITDVMSRVDGLRAERIVGRRIERVEANGKHLLMRLDSGEVVHSHLRMTGSWHVYRSGEAWQRPERQARLVITCSDRQAVCFNAPVVELLGPGAEGSHPSLGGLGPDVLAEPIDFVAVRRRAASRPSDLALGELLLDQRIVAGIGNIWRCEALAVEGHNPWTARSALSDDELRALVATAARLMRENLLRPGRPSPRLVYGRAGRPCRRCGTIIASRRQGEQARTAYWCPTCQPFRPDPPAGVPGAVDRPMPI